MKKLMKKLMAIITAAMMIVATAVPAMAAQVGGDTRKKLILKSYILATILI